MRKELKDLSKELCEFCKNNNLPSGKEGHLMGVFMKHLPKVAPFTTSDYDEDFNEVDCPHYLCEFIFEDMSEGCKLGIGIENCGHCFKNKALFRKNPLQPELPKED